MIVAAVAIYFTAGAALGALGGTAATAAPIVTATPIAGVGTAAATTATAATTAATVGTATTAATVGTAAASKGILGTLAANAGLVSTGLTTAANVANAAAERKDAKEYQKKIEENNKTQLSVLDDTRGILERTGYYSKEQQGVAKDASGQSVYQQNAAEQRQKVAAHSEKPQKAFNQATNTWEDVQA